MDNDRFQETVLETLSNMKQEMTEIKSKLSNLEEQFDSSHNKQINLMRDIRITAERIEEFLIKRFTLTGGLFRR